MPLITTADLEEAKRKREEEAAALLDDDTLPQTIGATDDGLARPLPDGEAIGTAARYLFNQQHTAIANALSQAPSLPEDQEDELAWLVTILPDFEDEQWQTTAREVFTPPIREIAHQEGLNLLRQLKPTPDVLATFDKTSTDLATRLGTDLATQANADTQKEVTAAIQKVGEAADVAEIEKQPFDVRKAVADSLQDVFTRANDVRAPFYAGNAAVQAANQGEIEAVKVSPAVSQYVKSWIRQANACPICIELSELDPVGVDKPFVLSDGSEYYAPLAHWGCQCSLRWDRNWSYANTYMSHYTPHIGPIGLYQMPSATRYMSMGAIGELPILTMSGADGDGHWETIHGAHVFIGKGGTIEKGPGKLIGKTTDEAAAIDKGQSKYTSGEQTVHAKTVTPLHEIKSKGKLGEIKQSMKSGGWKGRPLLAVETENGKLQGLTGSHRIVAAKSAGLDVPVHVVTRDEMDKAGLDSDYLKSTDDVDKEYQLRRHGLTKAADMMQKEIDENELRGMSLGPIGKLPDMRIVGDMLNMSQDSAPPKVFCLASPHAAFRASPEGLTGRETVYMGQPVHYYWKDLINVGDYKHPTKNFHMSITKPDVGELVKTGKAMVAAGINIPILYSAEPSETDNDHSIDAQGQIKELARNSLGNMIDFKADGNQIMGLCRFVGDDAEKLASRNEVSIGLDPKYIDGKGNDWGRAIVHVALTPVPVAGDQGQFIQAASRNTASADVLTLSTAAVTPKGDSTMSDHMMPCSQATMDHLHKMVPGLSDAPLEEKAARVAQHLHTYSMMDDADAGGPSSIGTMSRADIITTAATNRAALKAERDRLAAERVTLNDQMQTMSRQVVKPLDDEAESAVVEALDTKLSMCMSRGAIDNTTGKQLKSLLIGEPGKRNLLSMSRAANPTGDKSFASALLDVLGNNKPLTVNLGAATNAQNMSRHSPDEKTPQEKRATDAAAAMAASAAKLAPVTAAN